MVVSAVKITGVSPVSRAHRASQAWTGTSQDTVHWGTRSDSVGLQDQERMGGEAGGVGGAGPRRPFLFWSRETFRLHPADCGVLRKGCKQEPSLTEGVSDTQKDVCGCSVRARLGDRRKVIVEAGKALVSRLWEFQGGQMETGTSKKHGRLVDRATGRQDLVTSPLSKMREGGSAAWTPRMRQECLVQWSCPWGLHRRHRNS